MNRKNLAPEGEKAVDPRRGSSQPLHTVLTTANESSFAASNAPLKSTMEDMRRRIVHLNKELEQERMHSKNLKRDKALEIRQVRDEEQRKAAAMQADLRSKLHKEKMNEITSLKEQLHKEKEKDIVQVMRQKDEALRNAQQAWLREKEEMKSKLRNELRNESREDTKREFEKERGRLEQEIADLNRQKRELEETLKLVQGADKRKIDDIRRIHHEHEAELEKFKRNSWQESRQQMAEIRQLLNIIEQLEKKLGWEAGHTMRLRLEKDSLYDMLKKSTTYDAWDRMMSSTMKEEQGQITPPATPVSDLKQGNQELRMLQRKNVELSSLVRKLDEKNQQFATRNAELLAELEKLEKENRDKNKKLERKNADLTQTNKRLESRNKLLLDEINASKKSSASRKDNSVKPRGRTAKEQDEVGNLRAQLREQTRNIADLKQSLIDKDRRIELLRSRKKKSKRQTPTPNSLSADFLSVEDDDALSVHSDFSEASEMSSSDDVDSKRIKKLAKELLALERAYALLQAHVGSAVDAERDEMEKQQLQSDLIESQTRIHELERMMDEGGQGTRSEELSQIQADNKALYQKLVTAEKDRDKAHAELSKYTEDVRELKDQRDLLEFELEEMSQLSTAGSEDWDSRRPRSTCSLDAFPTPRKDNDTADLSLEEIKACLEELETEKENVLSPLQQSALKQARVMLESMAEKINHMEFTESALRDKVRDLDLGYNSESLRSEFGESSRLSMFTCDKETLTDLQSVELEDMERFYKQQQIETLGHLTRADADIPTEDTCCMTDLVWEDLVSMESIYRKHMNGFPDGNGDHDGQHEREDKECMTDLAWKELADLEESYRNYLEDYTDGNRNGKGEIRAVDNQTMTDLDLEELEELESSYQMYLEEKVSVQSRKDTETMTDMIWEEILQRTNDEIYLILSNEVNKTSKKREGDTTEVGVMTDLVLSELVEMEDRYWEYIDNESKINMQKEELVETLPEIVLDTFPEDVTNTKDEYAMTDLKWDDIVELQDKCDDYERNIQELESKVAHFEVEKDKKGSCTEMTFTDLTFDDLVNLQDKCRGYECIIKELETKLARFEIEKDEKGSCTEMTFTDLTFDDLVNLEDKCRGYECILKELETKLAYFEIEKDEKGICTEMTFTDLTYDDLVNLEEKCRGYECVIKELETKLAHFEIKKDEKGSSTEISLQDIANARFNVEMKDAETMTGVPEDVIDNEGLPEIVLATFPGEIQTKDECDMTEGVWDEVVDLKNTYQDYRQNLEEMKQKLAQFEVEKDDKESITDIAMQDLADLESLYREHLREEDSDSNSLLSHPEKESKECMTELTFIEITELEDFYIENAARQMAASPVVEKWEQESMTDITLDDMKYFEEAEDLFRCSSSAAEKDIKYTETMTEEMPTQKELLQVVERVEVDTMTELTIPDLELLEVTQELHQGCPAQALGTFGKEDRSVGTELTAEDLKYWEDVEAAHEECLLDREENEGKAERDNEEKQDAEMMTEFTMMDLYYLEEVDAAHEECLVDRENERVDIEKLSVEVMTEMSVSDLQYLEDVESAHEECLVDRKENFEASDVEKRNAEVMTDLTVLDLRYLEEVEVAHEECLVDKQEELDGKDITAEKESAESMTEMTMLDVQYLEDKQEQLESRSVDKQNAEIMTDLTIVDLRYLEDVEAAHEECLADKEELQHASVGKENAAVMTDLTASDLQHLEDVETAHEECRLDKEVESNVQTIDSEKQSVGTMTDMTNHDLRSLESTASEKEKTKTPKFFRRRSRSSSLTDQHDHHHHHKNTMTEMTSNILDYYEDIEVLYKESMVEFDEFKRLHSVEKEEKDVMTDVTIEDLELLEEERLRLAKDSLDANEDEKETEDKETITELLHDDLEHLMEVESLHKEGNGDQESKILVPQSDEETMTEVSLSYIEHVEEELARLQHLESHERDSSWVFIEPEKVDKDVMTTGMTESELQNLKKVEALYNEKVTEPAEITSKANAEVMTDLTTADLEYFEEAESLLKQISGDGGDISAMLAPKDDKEMITDLTSSDIDYLQVLGDVYGGGSREAQAEGEVDKDDKGTATELTIADIRDLEDQVDSAAEVKAMHPFREFVSEDLKAETLVGLQSELDYLPILDEPEFILDEEDREEGEDIKREETGVMTEMTIADIRDLEDQVESAAEMKVAAPVMEDYQFETLEGLQTELEFLPVLDEPEFILDEETEEEDTQRQDTEVMTELTLVDLKNLEAVEQHRRDEHLEFPERIEAGVQCDVEGITSLMQELSKAAEEHGENVPAWFVTAFQMRQPEGGFNPVHLVVRESDGVDAFPTDEHSDVESQFENVLEETALANSPIDLMNLSEDSPRSPRDVPIHETAPSSWIAEEGDSFSKDVGVQCDLVDFLTMLEEYQRNTNEDVMPWFVSAMNMSRDDTGYDPVQVVLRKRSDSSPVQDDRQSTSLMVELSRPPPPPRDSTFTVDFPPHEQLDDHQFPEADSPDPLFTSQDGSDSVFNRTDESIILPNDTEESDVLTDMPQSSSAVNRFDRFLKERKDSELLNLQVLKEDLDKSGNEGTVDVKSLKELEEENELLRRQLQMLENTTNAEELENELAALKEKVENAEELENELAALKEKAESVNDLEEENQLLKEEITILRESASVKEIEEENQLQNTEELQNEIAALKEKVESMDDLEEENQLLKEEITFLRESASVKDLEEEKQLRNTEDLQNEIACLKEKVESMDDLEEENQLLKEEINILRESASVKDLEEENQRRNTEELQNEIAALKEKVESVNDLKEENQLLKEEIAILRESVLSEDIEEENALLKDKIKMLEEMAVAEQDVKEIEKENEELREKVKTLEESTNTKDLEQENDFLKKQVEMLAAEQERVKELEEENELLQDKLQAVEQSTNVQDLVNENSLLKDRIEVLVEPENVAEDLLNENALLKEKIDIMEEAGRAKELEYENDVLKQKVQMLEESSTVERLENEQLMEKIQDLEDSTARVVERLEEENAMLKENIQILEDSTTNMKDLEDENALLREKIDGLGGSKNVQELEKENATLKEKIRSLEESPAGDLPNEEFELLKLKVEQLKEAEKKIGTLNEANMALKETVDLLQMEKKNVRENWSEMDPSEQLGKADRGVQANFDDGPPSIQYLPGVSGGVNLLKLLEVTPDGSIPENIAKELEILKQENRELYEELMELRRKIKARQVAQRSNEATQTEHAYLRDSFLRDANSGTGSIEEPIAPQVRTTVATEIRYLGDSYLEFETSLQAPPIWVESLDLNGQDGLIDYPEINRSMPSYNENVRDSGDLISEPELVSSRRNLDSVMDDIDRRIHDLQHLDDQDMDRARTDTSDLVVLDSDDDGDLPPLPESSPPPLPSEPPPDFQEASPPVLDYGIESLLSSPPRNAATLRASSRARSHSENKPSSEPSQPSSRVESPVTVEEPTLVLATDPSELGSAYPEPLSVRRPSGLGSTKVPPKVFPKPKKTLQMRQPGQLHKPLVSYDSTNSAPQATSQWSRDEEDGVIPPRGIVRNRASSINRGEIDTLNEKIGFLERQLKNKENVIRSMKTDATELETRSLLERKDREMKILDEDVAFLKKENQKKERELLTKIGEANKKNYEIEQWKAEANNSERQRQRMEAAHMNLQSQMKTLQGAELKLAELQTKYSAMEKQNFELSEKVKKLERTEREFKKLEHNIQLLQAQVQEMDIVEQDRNSLVEKMKTIENQRDDLLRKGRVVESERNDFLRNNKLMEMQRDDLENRCAMLQKTNATLNSRLAELERDVKEAQTKMHDSHHERNFLQVQLDKMEAEKNEMQKRLAITTQDRNSLENQVAELEELSRDHVKLEDGFHNLRIKLAESTRDKDDAEMQIPTLKAKIALLKRACKEKDEHVDRLSEEIRELRHAIATSALDDLSKIRTAGYTPENFVKLSAQREQERQIAKREPEDLVGERLKSRLDKQSQRRSPRAFAASPPGTKKAKRFVALFDYDPYKSPASEHPELELKLKDGDFLTVYGDMDINGYFEADVNGVRGLVPSLYVDELEDDNESDVGLEELLARSRRDPVKDVSSYKGNELLLQRDNISSGHVTPSSNASSVGSEPRQCMVALHDYDPFHSGAPGRPAHEQLSLRKGDVLTAFGDMDVNGFYRVDLNGQTGFVPGHLVEEVSSSSFLQPTKSRAPEQILGMLDNIQVRGQPKGTSTDVFPPTGVTNGYPTHAHGDVTPPRHVQPPGGPLPNVGLTRFKPSPEVAKLGPSPRAVVVPENSSPSSQGPALSVVPQALVTTKPSPSKQVVPVSSNKSRSSRKARPSPPSFFRVLRPVNHDAILVGWLLPEMDEFGRSNGLTVKGYKIYANSDVKLEVRSPYMAKALVEDLDLRIPIKFSIKTVAENGCSSEAVSATFSNTIKGNMDSFGESFEKDSGDDQKHYRTFVALYHYDPFSSSPNPNPASELSFKEGDILRVFDTSRKDGFYVGKLKSKSGLIPSNFVEEVAVATPRRLAAAKKRQASLPSPTRPFSRESSSSGGVGLPSLGTKDPAPLRRKMMVAMYDYNPEVQSPQDNPDSELSFKKGQVLAVLGEMRADGFCQADLNGQLGLVPGSFLDEYTNGEVDSGLDSERRVSKKG